MPVLPPLNLPSETVGVSRRSSRRCGFTITELIVSATLLVVVMSVVATLTVRSGRLWQDSCHYRLAIEELSNHLERLTSLDEESLALALPELHPSPQVRVVLPHPELSAEFLSDKNGTRLVLQLAWDRLGRNTPVTLVGWVNPLPTSETSAANEETP